jgi:hypothetical protein
MIERIKHIQLGLNTCSIAFPTFCQYIFFFLRLRLRHFGVSILGIILI